MRSTAVFIVILSILMIAINCSKDQPQIEDAPDGGFVGEQTCRSCHEQQYTLWKGSHHDWAMAEAADSTVLGDFNDVQVSLDGVDYTFRREIDDFWVDVREVNGDENSFRIEYTFGVTPLQQYITALEDGKHQVLRASWDSDLKKWYHQYAGDEIHPTDWLHWLRGGQRWNTMCAECHSTNLKRNYDFENDAFQTTWSSINVSCEACHGPGHQHVQWAGDGDLGDEAYISAGRTQQEQVDQCGPCHARRVRLTYDLEVGLPFDEQYILQTATPAYYHPDGQILEEDYVLGSFLQSKMFLNNVKCNDCHDPHSMQLKFVGNTLCMQCHEPQYNTEAHHFHPIDTESSECISCHMTGDVYMGNDFRRDHSFRIPRPDQSVLYGTPNACTGCHTDQSDDWAARQVEEWYGDERPPHYSDPLLLSTRADLTPGEKQRVLDFLNDITEPYLTRATAIDNLDLRYTPAEIEALLTAMKDSAALVRRKAMLKFGDAPAQERHALAMQMLSDTARMVRIAAAELSTDINPAAILSDQRMLLDSARAEYETMLKSNLDFPIGRMHYGDYLFRTGNTAGAIKQYRVALSMDSLLTVAYPNLATALSSNGQNGQALQILNTLLDMEPEFGRGYYLRALLLYEMQDQDAALRDFKSAIDYDPSNYRAYYNRATLQYQMKDFKAAESTIQDGLQLFPSDGEGRYLLALILQAQGREEEAGAILQSLR